MTRTVLITGASTGLGLALARRLLREPELHLILTARASSLARFEAQGIAERSALWIRPLDVTSGEQRAALISEIETELGGVDVLVNNAGISYRSVIEHVTDEERRHQMEVNYQAPMALSRLVLPRMRARGGGHIIQISSAGGLIAMPTMGVYAASKFALEAASEAMFYEVRPFGIRVTLVLPGFINSDSFERVLLSGESRDAIRSKDNVYHLHYRHMVRFISRLMRITPATPESVARTIVKTIKRRYPPLRVPATWDTRLLWWFRRFMPQRAYHLAMYWFLPSIRQWGKPGEAITPKLPSDARIIPVKQSHETRATAPPPLGPAPTKTNSERNDTTHDGD